MKIVGFVFSSNPGDKLVHGYNFTLEKSEKMREFDVEFDLETYWDDILSFK